MSHIVSPFRRRATRIAAIAALSLAIAAQASAQNAQAPAAPAGGGAPQPSPTKIALENRKAAYTLIGNTFRWFGGVARGNVPYNEAEAAKRASRILFLAALPSENFPEGSNFGEPESKAKADVWSNRADFDKKLREFQEHAAALVEVNAKEKGATEAFKAAVATLGQDCKGCHDTYRAK
ncbi:MAG TPA: cytochrome c [Methylocystis sp.]|nr:cytochrome c [Methylocystis sp.]